MPRLLVRTPSRLHFGLLSWGAGPPRQFGGIGLMIDAPALEITAEPAPNWSAEGPSSGRVLELAVRVADRLASRRFEVKPARMVVHRAPPEHSGLGSGTQVGLGVARLLTALGGWPEFEVVDLAGLAGRGLRSGIGLHGFARGGLIVDGGRRGPEGIPPLLAHVPFPTDWSVLVLIPRPEPGLHGPAEVRAFAELPPSPGALVDRLCHLVLLGILPAVIEHDLPRFGEALEELQERVGRGFAPAQGGIFARPELETIAGTLRALNLKGVGQSSWGPTLYGFSDAPAADRAALLAEILARTGLPPSAGFWTSASLRGATLEAESTSLDSTRSG